MIEEGYSFCSNSWALDTRIKNELPLLLIISSMCAKTGETYAGNKYFSEIFDCTETSISLKINKLIKIGYLDVEYEKHGCEIKSRKLRIKNFLFHELKNFNSTDKKVLKDNNIYKNNNNNTLTSINNTPLPPKDKFYEKYGVSEEELSEPMKLWLNYKAEKKKSYTKTGFVACLEKLNKLSGGDEDLAMEIVKQSLANNWDGLFPLKNTQSYGKSKNQQIIEKNFEFLEKAYGGESC